MTERFCRCLLALILLSLFIHPAPAKASDDYWAPWVTSTTTDSATINWRGEEKGSGSIDYATSSYFNTHNGYEKTIATTEPEAYQHVRISGLESNTSYTYRVRPSGDVSAFGNRSFRTMPVNGPFTFIVVGDTREGVNYPETKRFKPVADAIAKEPDVLFVLHAGDFCRHDYEPSWATFFKCADEMLAKSAFFPAIGNHEYHEHKNKNLDEEHYCLVKHLMSDKAGRV